MHPIFVFQVLGTFMMTGIIWFVQIVHYPLFAMAGEQQFQRYAASHARRTGWIVGPVMILELSTAILLCLTRFRPASISIRSALSGVALLLIIWASTAWVQVPLHNDLASGYRADLIRRLALSNWIRTIAWSLRTALILWWITIF